MSISCTSSAGSSVGRSPESGPIRVAPVYWTAFIGLFFDYYDLFLFIYLEGVLAAHFLMTQAQSNLAQVTALAGVGMGSLIFGYLADRFGRGRLLLVVFAVYLIGILGVAFAWNFASLLGFRVLASLALGAEWGISHTYLSERLPRDRRYLFAALLQFSILGGLLASLASRFLLPEVGWRALFAFSLLPVVVLSLVRFRALSRAVSPRPARRVPLSQALRHNAGTFLLCLALAACAISSGTINVFVSKELPHQSVWFQVLFWGNVAPGMLLGAALVRRSGVRAALITYAVSLGALSLWAYGSDWTWKAHAFALTLPLVNGIPFGLMGAYFNELFGEYRTMLSGTAYNLGRIFAGFSPALITGLHLHKGERYFLFSAAIGAVMLVLGATARRINTLDEGEPPRASDSA